MAAGPGCAAESRGRGRVAFDLKLDKPPAGYATRPARGGEKVDVQVSGFLTPDDGEILFK